jgi:uroporphyrinogen-III synthase hemD
VPKIKSILVSQPQPEGTKSPYFDIAEKHDLKVVFRPFIKVEGYSINEFSKQKINIPDYSAIVFVARTGGDHFFRLAKEGKMKIVPEMKYFCLTESFAYYIQKYIKFRKRKIFSATTGRIADLFAMLEKNSSEKFLIVLPENGNEELEKLLSKSKLNYTKAYMYRTVSNDFGKNEKFDYDMVIFFSPFGVQSFINSFPNFEQGPDKYFGCLGTAAAQSLKEAGFRVDIEVPNPQFSSITLAIEDFVHRNHKGGKK